MAPSNLIGALEMLATKRREFTSAIVTLASALGVDAAPYLSHGDANSSESMHLPLQDRLRDAAAAIRTAPKQEPPPRPPSPASPSTNGTGQSDKVETSRGAEILALLKSHGRGSPVRPGVISKAMKVTPETLRRHLDPLIAAGQVKVQGKTSGRRLTLA